MERVSALPPIPLELRQAAERFRQIQLKSYKFKFKMKYGELFALFQNLDLSFTDIGDRLGVSRERVRQLHKEFFWTVRSPEVRSKFRGRTPKRENKKTLLLGKEPLRTLIACVDAMGFPVKLVSEKSYISNKKLDVNEKKCLVGCTYRAYGVGNRPYVRIVMPNPRRVSGYEFFLVYAYINQKEGYFRHVFCLPLRVFAKRHTLYIPLEYLLKSSDWYKYCDEEGLSLLKS